MTTLILTGWGWKEYAVAASVVLKALDGQAELLNLLERAAVLEEDDFNRLVSKHREMNAGLMGSATPENGGIVPDELEQVIKSHIKNVFYKYAQNLSRASAVLKISRNTMRKYLEEAKDE